MTTPHLTAVIRTGKKPHPWHVSCLCGWNDDTRLKREAITAGEMHWLSMPVVTKP
jgi:hypothetical protein